MALIAMYREAYEGITERNDCINARTWTFKLHGTKSLVVWIKHFISIKDDIAWLNETSSSTAT